MTSNNIANITHHDAGPIDGSGRPRRAEYRVYVPGWATAYIPHDAGEEAKAEAYIEACGVAQKMLTEDPFAL